MPDTSVSRHTGIALSKILETYRTCFSAELSVGDSTGLCES
jgi:hypothetical protein